MYDDDSNNIKSLDGYIADGVTIGMLGFNETTVDGLGGEEEQSYYWSVAVVDGPIRDGGMFIVMLQLLK